MKKAISNTKLPNPSKFVRRVLSRGSAEARNVEAMKNRSECLELELTSLKDQISILQITVGTMQEDVEKRENVFATVAREKQQLAIDLRRERRSSTNLKQQLDEEREFYYKEKEQYCKEMNNCKKLKKKIATENVDFVNNEGKNAEMREFKSQITKLKEALNQTLEANYNLSVKFLRMKNTKIYLKNRLKKLENDHEKAMRNFEKQIGDLKNNITEVADKRFTSPVSPSNKKYLQIIKQNGCLLHENLVLQMEIDGLTREKEELKYSEQKKPATHKTKDATTQKTIKSQSGPSKVSKARNVGEKGETPKKSDIIKIYERNETAGIPQIVIDEAQTKDTCVQGDFREENDVKPSITTLKQSESNCHTISSRFSSQIDTEFNLTRTCSDLTNSEAIRTQSAPEIVQTSLFVSQYKP